MCLALTLVNVKNNVNKTSNLKFYWRYFNLKTSQCQAQILTLMSIPDCNLSIFSQFSLNIHFQFHFNKWGNEHETHNNSKWRQNREINTDTRKESFPMWNQLGMLKYIKYPLLVSFIFIFDLVLSIGPTAHWFVLRRLCIFTKTYKLNHGYYTNGRGEWNSLGLFSLIYK